MKEYIVDFVTGTIVAAVLTLLSYIVGFDKTWDEAAQTWMLEPGKVKVCVGGSSDSLPLSSETEIN
jgi:hypothetical protein